MLQIKVFEFSPIAENTYILHNEQLEAIIVDPGCYFSHEKDTLLQYIKDNHLVPKYLLNTHCHFDHIFGNRFVHQQWQLIPNMHALEIPVLQFAKQAAQRWNLSFEPYTGPTHLLNEGDELLLGNDTLKVILAPGHSPGHICFYCEAQHWLLGGDVLFNRSIGRTDLPGGNHPQLIESIRKKLMVLPDETIVFPGHGPSTTIGEERVYNPFLQ